jgi:hypothetical protein
MSLEQEILDIFSTYQKIPPRTVDVSEEYPCICICIGHCCVGCIVLSDKSRFYASDGASLHQGILDGDFIKTQYTNAFFDRYSAVETKLPEHFSGLGEKEDNLLVIRVSTINGFQETGEPMIEQNFSVPLAYQEDGKIFASKLSFHHGTVIRASYSRSSYPGWFPKVFGKTWNWGSYRSSKTADSITSDLFNTQEIEEVLMDPGCLPLTRLEMQDGQYPTFEVKKT